MVPIILAILVSVSAAAQTGVSFSAEDGGLVYADVYGEGDRAVVLAHGGQFNKESWKKQADALVAAKFRVLALDFRGYGQSRGPGDSDPMDAPLYQDVLAAVRYLHKNGAKTVSVVGASMGGWAAGDASIASQPGEIDRLIFLGSAPTGPARQAQVPIPVHRGTQRCQRRWAAPPRNPRTIRESSQTSRAHHPRWLGPRPVSLPN